MIYLGVVGIAVARSKRCPVIGTVHQLPWFISAYLPDLPGLKLSLERSLWFYCRWVNQQCDAIIAPTPTIAHTIQSETGSRTIDISNGVDLSRFTPRPALPDEKAYLCQKHALDPNRPIILHVGRLDVDKDVEKVIYAAAKTLRATNAQLLVVGDGECKGSLEALANQLGISECCRFPGFVAHDGDLPGVYRMADVFTTASQIETQGLVLLEALASGLPVVAVEATCIPELVKDNITGYLVPPNDVDALASGLIRAIENPAQAKTMGRHGQAFVQKHAIERTLDRHEYLYKEHVALRQTVQMRWNRL
jgi:glycosyltransferase involved in cell wall biosynthesis